MKRRNKFSDFMGAVKMSRALQSPAGVRVTLCLPHARKEPRNLRLLGTAGGGGARLVPCKLSHSEVEDLVAKAKAKGERPPVKPLGPYARQFGADPTAQWCKDQAATPRSPLDKLAFGTTNTWSRLSGSLEFVDPGAGRATGGGVFMTDLVDCRPGMFSPAFADLITSIKQGMRYFGLPKDALVKQDLITVTLIGSERTLSVQGQP